LFSYRNEAFVFAASALTTKLFICVHDHKTIGKDKDLGDAEVEVGHLFSSVGLCLLGDLIKDLASP